MYDDHERLGPAARCAHHRRMDAARVQVLLVHDQPESPVALEAIFSDLDVHLITAQSGQDVPRHLIEKDFALILLDMDMTEMGAIETVQRLGLPAKRRLTPLCLLTASHPSEADIEQAYTLGVVDHIVKPVVPEILRAKVEVFTALYHLKQSAGDERFETLVDLSPDATVLVDCEGRVLYANPALASLFGTTTEDMRQQPFGFPVVAHNTSEIHLIVEGKPARTAEMRVTQIAWDGQAAYLATLRDISDRLWLIEDLERSNKDLNTFAYIASHDLKAPLRAIANLTTWIAEDAGDMLPEASRNDLALVQQRIARMEALLESLLHYSRIGRVTAEVQAVDTGDLVTDMLALLDVPVEFSIDVAASMPTLHTPPTPLELVFRNLIGNAIKHHDRVDGCITVTGRETGVWVEFVVADDGPGIPAAYHDQIFQLFQTLKPRDEVEGSGMGLAMVKKTVESYGGSISVESGVDRGACFRFTWPKDTTQRR